MCGSSADHLERARELMETIREASEELSTLYSPLWHEREGLREIAEKSDRWVADGGDYATAFGWFGDRARQAMEQGTKVPDPEVMRRYYAELDAMEQARRPTGGNEACD